MLFFLLLVALFTLYVYHFKAEIYNCVVILKREKCKDAAKATTQLKLSNLPAAFSWMENDAIKNLDDAREKSPYHFG